MEVRPVYCKKLPFLKKLNAITIYPFIFYFEDPDTLSWFHALEDHEMQHIRDCRAKMDRYSKYLRWIGWLEFHIHWSGRIIRYGYKDNPYEVKGREASRNHDHDD